MPRVVIYMRVSTKKQTNLNQFIQLRKAAKDKGWPIVGVYRDRKSGKNIDRSGFRRMMRDAQRGKFDILMVYSPSRLGRRMLDIVNVIHDLGELGVDLYALSPSIDTTSRMGKAFFYVASVFSEMDREDLIERVHTGLERARTQGKNLGRPDISHIVKEQVLELRRQGKGIHTIRREVGCSAGTVQKVLKAQ